MVDIETLSTRRDAAVIAIGSVIFNADNIIATQLLLIDPAFATGHVAQDTVEEFWYNSKEVSPYTRAVMFSGTLKPWDACVEFANFVTHHNPEVAFANPPQFDYAIMRRMFDACEYLIDEFPVHWRAERDCRTLFQMAEMKGIDLNPAYEGAKKHDALSDAECQARAVQICNREL